MKIGTGSQQVILGAPGCGKTTSLLDLLDEEIRAGVEVDKIAFVSFTRKAVQEVVRRTSEKFGLEKSDLPYFKTIHALCYRELGVKQNELIAPINMEEFSKLMGIPFTANMDDATGLSSGASTGDEMLFYASLARVKRQNLSDLYHGLSTPAFTWHMLKQLSRSFDAFRSDTGLLDFTDILEQYARNGDPVRCEVAFIDEAQDLSTLQWETLLVAFANCKRVYIAGDDDQAIYSWSGADIETFLNLQGEQRVLGVSHRMPRSVFELSQKIIRQVSRRYEKEVVPRNEAGSIQFHNSPQSIPVDPRQGSWLVLARNTYALSGIESNLRLLGIPYTRRHGGSSINPNHVQAIRCWEKLRAGHQQPGAGIKKVYDQLKVGHGVRRGFKSLPKMEDEIYYSMEELKANFGLLTDGIWHEAFRAMVSEDIEYYLSVLRTYGVETFTGRPEVHVNTIHGVKGGEADNVVLFLDQARRTHQEYLENPDAERRVMYVGVTRTKKNLHIVQPQSTRFFQLPS